MTVLVSAASKHGSTTQIAERITQVLREHGLAVDLRPAENVTMVDAYDAVVLGSAVYAGHWMKPARQLVDSEATALRRRPVWLFSSGPIGDPPKPDEDPVDLTSLREASAAREHRIFPGRIDKQQLGLTEKAIMLALHAPQGDFRDWQAIETWAAGIADTLNN